MGTQIFSKEMFPRALFSTQNTHREQTETLCRLTGWNCATVLWWRPVADPGLRGSPIWRRGLGLKKTGRPFVGLLALEGGWGPLQNAYAITCFMAHVHTFSRCENGCGKKQVDKNACNVCLDVFQRFPEGNLEPHTGRTIKLTDKMTTEYILSIYPVSIS